MMKTPQQVAHREKIVSQRVKQSNLSLEQKLERTVEKAAISSRGGTFEYSLE